MPSAGKLGLGAAIAVRVIAARAVVGTEPIDATAVAQRAL